MTDGVYDRFPKQYAAGILSLIAAAPVAYALFEISAAWSDHPEKAASIAGAMLAALFVVPPTLYLIRHRRAARLDEFGLLIVGTVAVLLAACYFFWASFDVRFPADFIIWSESDFVGDILKFRQNYPIFTADANNESFTYVPGAQLATYFLAWIAGFPTSVSAYRVIQIFYTVLAAAVAFSCCRRLLDIVFGKQRKVGTSMLWGAVWLSGLFLLATNALTNPFTHLLHNDALAQLITVAAYRLLLEYEATKNRRLLWLMCLVPAVGFWVKQSLLIWAVLYAAYLLIFDEPRSLKRFISFAVSTVAATAVSIFAGFWLWNEYFIYWVFTVLGAHGVSVAQSFKHLSEVWIFYAAGIAGGAILLSQADAFKKLFGHWLVWLTLLAAETYTSGVAWMLNHIGPGSLLAGVWFFGGLAVVWEKIAAERTIKESDAATRLCAAAGAAVLCLLLSGFGAVRFPVQLFDWADAERYAREIEAEFAGESPELVLLDFGNWVYLPSGTVMKDRAPTVGERGWSQTGDFSGIRGRLAQKHYRKILMRELQSPDFWYDHALWRSSSSIRETLLENYREVKIIRAVKTSRPDNAPYGFREISVLVPRED